MKWLWEFGDDGVLKLQNSHWHRQAQKHSGAVALGFSVYFISSICIYF